MPSEESSARRYAQAALDLANQNGAMAHWVDDMDLIGRVWQDDHLRHFVEDARLSKQERMGRVREVLSARVSHLALNLVLLMIWRGRARLVPRMVAQFTLLHKQQEGIAEAEVTSALPLTETQISNLAGYLSQSWGQTVTITNTVDPSILGGLIVRQGDRLLDASVIGKLRRLELQISGSPGARRARII